RRMEHAQPGLDILLDHVDAGPQAGQHLRVVDLDTVARAAFGRLEVRQQRAVAAPEVEDVRARRDPVGDQREVRAQSVHRLPPCARTRASMRSNHARITAMYCGSSSRNASWPCGASISA